MKTFPLFRRAPLATLVLLLVAGCAGPAVQRNADGSPQRIVTTDYKQVYVTGSHIPILVPTSPTARTLPTISPLDIITPDDLRRMPGGGPFH